MRMTRRVLVHENTRPKDPKRRDGWSAFGPGRDGKPLVLISDILLYTDNPEKVLSIISTPPFKPSCTGRSIERSSAQPAPS
jgi:hypothetical protein